ncbi:tripeptide aminopeptidase [Sedimentibacter acidaminivorans]|uniref:Peptidase T n=1 Tax=Sedimentibacter acidaminivorans TaxID=913099 RepID=A0ABS4GAG2_9FIRM|nr:peptidase T [Sedimentibacter acidaminivorans]MBP1924390.1 tripeptide aminopeptidase [Sedimentibacter acidaminivorans]
MLKVHERFLNYVAIDTQSVDNSDCFPSSEKQKNLASILVKEMKNIGISDADMDNYGYVYGSIPGNSVKPIPTIGFIAHMDTSPDMPGDNVKAKIVKNYDGKDIVLNKEKNIVMKTDMFEHMQNYIGQDLIVTDGTTLLGADNKAGIAEIMSLAEFLINNPDIKHGTIKIAFTPDEEVGSGAEHFNVENFGADFAYTVDGGRLGEIEYENFNAASAKVIINGINIHPGSAKNKMKNSILIAIEFQQMLPIFETPANTENYEGFNHLCDICGSVEETKLSYIIRDHDANKFKAKKDRFFKIADYLNEKYGSDTVVVELKDSYLNMKEMVLPHIHIVETAVKAMKELNIEPEICPIRGGTDGARLSYMGLPCPNLCTGGHNFHGKYEYISIQSMESVVEILTKIVELYAK